MSTEPLPSLADLLAEADRVERDAIALWLSFPRAVGRTLRLAARVGAVNRRAVSLNTELARAGVARRVAPVRSAVPLGVVDAMFLAMLDAEPVEAQAGREASPRTEVGSACHAPPGGAGEAIGGQEMPGAGPSPGVEGMRGSRHTLSRQSQDDFSG